MEGCSTSRRVGAQAGALGWLLLLAVNGAASAQQLTSLASHFVSYGDRLLDCVDEAEVLKEDQSEEGAEGASLSYTLL